MGDGDSARGDLPRFPWLTVSPHPSCRSLGMVGIGLGFQYVPFCLATSSIFWTAHALLSISELLDLSIVVLRDSLALDRALSLSLNPRPSRIDEASVYYHCTI